MDNKTLLKHALKGKDINLDTKYKTALQHNILKNFSKNVIFFNGPQHNDLSVPFFLLQQLVGAVVLFLRANIGILQFYPASCKKQNENTLTVIHLYNLEIYSQPNVYRFPEYKIYKTDQYFSTNI